jgi:diacylglycerol O-acyltransferase
VSTIVDGVGLNITVLSYRDHMDVGIIGDRDQLQDAWSMLDGLRAALEEFHSLLGAEAAAAAPAPELVSP